MEAPEPIYKITVETFFYKDEAYTVALSPELCNDEGGLDFTGGYMGLLIHPTRGTLHICLTPDGNDNWDIDPTGIDPNVIDEIDKVIKEMR